MDIVIVPICKKGGESYISNIESCHCISYEQSRILYPFVNTNVKYGQKVTGDDQHKF